MTDILQRKIEDQVVPQGGDGPSHARVDEQRRQFMTAVRARNAGRSYVRWAYVFAAAATVLATVAIMVIGQDVGSISFTVGGSASSGALGDWVAAEQPRATSIRFEGGSVYRLEPGATARIARSDVAAVVVDLSNGKVNCKVVGNGKTEWIVRAGSYRVKVTGTEFFVQWHEQGRKLDVKVADGSVHVAGGLLNKYGVELHPGDHLQVTRAGVTISPDNAMSAVQPDANPGSLGAMATTRDDVERVGDRDAASDMATPTAATPGSNDSLAASTHPARMGIRADASEESDGMRSKTWKDLYRERNYNAAMALAETQGLELLVETASADDLTMLSKVARYTRSTKAAIQILKGMESRFQGSARAHNATFLLGRVAWELQRDQLLAGSYFEKYLAAAPDGPLADKALARLIEIYRDSGNDAGAENAARRYLAKYPHGSFASSARSVLE